MNRYDQKMQSLGAKPLGRWIGVTLAPLSDEELAEVEAELGHPLPEDYREFIRNYGFYHVDDPTFSATTDVGEEVLVGINTFKGLNDHPSFGEGGVLTGRQGFLENIEDWSPTWIPIASSGNIVIALTFCCDKLGEVLYTIPFEGTYYVVASSFDEFMHLLRKDE